MPVCSHSYRNAEPAPLKAIQISWLELLATLPGARTGAWRWNLERARVPDHLPRWYRARNLAPGLQRKTTSYEAPLLDAGRVHTANFEDTGLTVRVGLLNGATSDPMPDSNLRRLPYVACHKAKMPITASLPTQCLRRGARDCVLPANWRADGVWLFRALCGGSAL